MNGQTNIKEISKALISFLKEVSDIQSEFLTVGKEISLLHNYGIIQSYRYRNFHLKSDEMPPLCLLCENQHFELLKVNFFKKN